MIRPFQLLVLLVLFVSCSADPTVDRVSVNINPNRPISAAIRPNFVGFSIETFTALNWFGSNPKRVKDSFVVLMKQLMMTSGQRGPEFRIGGNSADVAAFSYDNELLPNTSFIITPNELIMINEAMKSINSAAVHDLYFRLDSNYTYGVNHVQAINDIIGWDNVLALEIGNECDLYGGNGYRDPKTWSFDTYVGEWRNYVNTIRAALPSLRPNLFQGATFLTSNWLKDLAGFTQTQQKDLLTVSIHAYPSTHCGHNVTIDQLLSDDEAESEANLIIANHLVSGNSNLTVPLQIGESNDVSCHGQPDVSDTFASALWLIDYLFNLARVNVRGISIHERNETNSYSVILWRGINSQIPFVQPKYYGVSLFNYATRDHCQIVATQKLMSSVPYVKVWSCFNDHRLTITIIHKNYTTESLAHVALNITLPQQFHSNNQLIPNATSYHLNATNIKTNRDIEWSGLTWRDTKDGRPRGVRRGFPVQPFHRGNNSWAIYEIFIRPASAMVVEINWRRPTETSDDLNEIPPIVSSF